MVSWSSKIEAEKNRKGRISVNLQRGVKNAAESPEDPPSREEKNDSDRLSPKTGEKASEAAKIWCVYMLRCGDGSLYTGATVDVFRRLARHQSGKGAAYTRSHLPVSLVYVEKVGVKGQALRREAEIKKMKRTEKLALIASKKYAADREKIEPGTLAHPKKKPASAGAVAAEVRAEKSV